MKKALLKDCVKQIKKTYKRFISLLLMALLGVGFFAGIRASSPDMKKTVDKYFDEQNVYDIQIISTLGLTDDDINSLKKIQGVENVYGLYSEDVLISFEEEENVIKILEANENINAPRILEGRMPQKAEECLIDYELAKDRNMKIGDKLKIEEQLKEDDEKANFKETNLEIVGIVKSPIYIYRDKGISTLGSGKVNYIMYVHSSNIESDIYTEISVLAKNAKELDTMSEKYENLIDTLKENIEKIKEERQATRYADLIEEANKKLDDAQKEFDTEKTDAEKKISDAEKEIANGKKELAKGEKELQDGKEKADVEFKNAEAQISAAETQLAQSQIQLDSGWEQFESQKVEAEAGIIQIDNGIETIKQTLIGLNENKDLAESVLSAIEKINLTTGNIDILINQYEEQIQNDSSLEDTLRPKINELKEKINSLANEKSELEGYGITEEKLAQIDAGILECNTQLVALEKQKKDIQNQLNLGEAELSKAQNEIANARIQIEVSKSKLADEKNKAAEEFVKAEKDIASARKELQDGEKELQEKKEEFETEIAKAEAKLIDAREKVNDIEEAKWYVLDRYGNSGYNNYSQDTENVARLGDVFPIVFFLIAILISLTTMTRMVEEERVQIGTLKALGYTKIQIMSKYIIYSVLATLVGGVLGLIIGLNFLPRIFITMYKMIYNFEGMVIVFNLQYSILGIGTMLACIVGATVYTASKELKSTPAELMRPKAPKPGKRVLLEKIPFIWKKLNFTQKVTIRNMFRYKKKFLMTVIGICGCTALIVTGFGLKDSISKIMDYQYGDIYNYDMLVGLKGTLNDDEIINTKKEIEEREKIEKAYTVYMTSEKAKNGTNSENIQIVVPANSSELNNVIKLKDLETGELLNLNNEGVFITDKLSKLLDVKVGDEIVLEDSDKIEYIVKVDGIVEHYISHYIYMSKDLYENIFEKDFSANLLYVQYDKEYAKDEEYNMSRELLKNSKISSITLTSNLKESMNETLSALNIVVYILIICAGILAFVVLYNLTNINISERIRELATIKVLGFYDKEVYTYVSREIVLLAVIGILLGLIAGSILNSFILTTCEIPMLKFKRIILPESYLYSVLITVVFTIIVNISTYFSLKKIDMIESLKSVE